MTAMCALDWYSDKVASLSLGQGMFEADSFKHKHFYGPLLGMFDQTSKTQAMNSL